MPRNKLYAILLIASVAGYIYFGYQWNKTQHDESVSLCMIKNVTGYACPSCGTTRAISAFIKGNFTESVMLNPFGIIVALLMVVVPLWIIKDLITKKNTFYQFYKKAEHIIQKKWIAIPLIILVVLNWIWNLNKGL
jgi:hypothetical protein